MTDNNVSVPIGPSEIAGFIVALASLATTFFGKDWHLAANAQALGIVVAGVVTVGIAISRAFKHHSLSVAGAMKYAAQLDTAFKTANASGLTNAEVTTSLATLQNAPGQVQTPPTGDVTVVPPPDTSQMPTS